MRYRRYRLALAIAGSVLFVVAPGAPVLAEQTKGRQIEEVLVTAERRESTVSDTSISITAFTGEFIEDFGIRNQEDLQNLVPAAVIEPYDMAIRGVGRNFRSLGGDPGIATYLNGVYSEDFGIASTEGGLFDIERIEFLRGPQGTLYGRNAIGGAVNFINKLPTEQFEGEARIVAGDYDLQEYYGVLSGPIIKDLLQARVTGVKRTRDGYYDDLSGNEDPGDYGDENYALSLRVTPADNLEINMRVNERSYARNMGGADAAGIINLTENEGFERDTTTYAWAYRAVNPNVLCPDLFTRTTPVASEGIIGGVGCMLQGRETFNFTNPTTGDPVLAQRVVAGVDFANTGTNTTDQINLAYGADASRQRFVGTDDLDSGDLKTDTNGQQDEFFDQQAVSMDIMWDINEKFGIKYIFGYTDYFYDRSSDVDLTSNALFDNTFYVEQETEYVSHEVQFFFDPTERLSVTSGLFYYDAKISQRADFYDYTCTGNPDCLSRHANDFDYAAAGFEGLEDVLPPVDLFYARASGIAAKAGGDLPGNCLALGFSPDFPDIPTAYCFGVWEGDRGDRINSGPSTIATNLEYETRTERYAFAAFTQGVYSFNDQWALTLGARWARDQLYGHENVYFYSESDVIPLGFTCDEETGLCDSSLAAVNQELGYLGENGEILDPHKLLIAGLPTTTSIWREVDKATEDITWRANLDWTPTDDDLIYLSATKGLRSGGFNLVFFSSNAIFEPEQLIAYELGYKGALFDGRLQLNTAAYLYDYEDVHTFAQGQGAFGYTTNVVAVPEAEMIGLDIETTWLATDRITLGLNFSYTKNEYTSDQFVVDPNDPSKPTSLFDPTTSLINIKGNQMIRVPEKKGGAWASYTWPLGDNGKLEFLANWSWIDRVYFSVFERKDQSAPSYERLDFRTTWHSPNEQWMVAAFVNNVTDEIGIRQIEQYFAVEEENYRRTGTPTDPRLWGLEVRYKMGAFR